LGTFGTIRAHGKFVPITIGHNTIEADPEKQQMSAEQVMREVQKERKETRALINSLDRRITYLESKLTEGSEEVSPVASGSGGPKKKAKVYGTARIAEVVEQEEEVPRRVIKKGKGRDGKKAKN
jgi:hypothetical protein